MSTSVTSIEDQPRDEAARRAGAFLLLTAAATIVMVFARISADADQPTLVESLRAIATNTGMYTFAGVARVMSGAVLVAAAWQVWKSTIIRERLGTPLVPYLLVASGVITAASGVCALVLAASVGRRIRSDGERDNGGGVHPSVGDGQAGLHGSGLGAGCCGAASVEGIGGGWASVGGDWHRDAADMGGRCDDCASNHRQRLLPVAGGRWHHAAEGRRGAARLGDAPLKRQFMISSSVKRVQEANTGNGGGRTPLGSFSLNSILSLL